VTHDQEEAFALADRIVVMDAGKAVQIGAPQEIYRQPNSAFVARFVGLNNIFEGELWNGALETPIGKIPVEAVGAGRRMVLLRPDRVSLGANGVQVLSGTLKEVTFRGGLLQVVVEVNQQLLSFDFPSSVALPEVGEAIQLSFDPAQAVQFLGEEKTKNP
jgi:ABC-type Fe3+/spermidine/putrescine transport system ATPase subunit